MTIKNPFHPRLQELTLTQSEHIAEQANTTKILIQKVKLFFRSPLMPTKNKYYICNLKNNTAR